MVGSMFALIRTRRGRQGEPKVDEGKSMMTNLRLGHAGGQVGVKTDKQPSRGVER
jgi:hypothetical protein